MVKSEKVGPYHRVASRLWYTTYVVHAFIHVYYQVYYIEAKRPLHIRRYFPCLAGKTRLAALFALRPLPKIYRPFSDSCTTVLIVVLIVLLLLYCCILLLYSYYYCAIYLNALQLHRAIELFYIPKNNQRTHLATDNVKHMTTEYRHPSIHHVRNTEEICTTDTIGGPIMFAGALLPPRGVIRALMYYNSITTVLLL